MRISWMIGGAQGLGVDTSANIFGAALAKAGYYLYGSREYYSNIKGRHSYFNVSISDKQIKSVTSRVNMLATFDAETVFQHFTEVKDFLIYDKALEGATLETVRSLEKEIADEMAALLENEGFGTTLLDVVKYLEKRGCKALPVEYGNIMSGIINEMHLQPPVAERARNMISAGVSFGLTGLDKSYLIDAIKKMFKNETFVNLNTLAINAGYALANDHYGLKPLKIDGHRIQVDGNTASAIGKISGGLRFQSYYPITPASDESTYIEANQMIKSSYADGNDGGVVVRQTEDELAAINAANVAALTGTRAATATSGPGFSLMNEGISWAGMNEVPVLITYYMRGSPATGLPTRSGQSDLKLAVNAGHGEFPRIVVASGDHNEVFSDAIEGLNLAERYQTPVVHIIEKTIANAYSILDENSIDLKGAKIDRGTLSGSSDDYLRFKFTESGISPRAFLGQAQMFYTGDEHNEFGHITEATSNRLKMYDKRNRKLDLADAEMPDEYRLNVFGESDTVLLTWGSPKGAILDAMEDLKAAGISIEMVQVRVFSPYPAKKVAELLKGKTRIIAVENNYYAQGAEILAEHTGIMPTDYILKWTGRPMTKDEIADAVKSIVNDDVKKVVLHGGE